MKATNTIEMIEMLQALKRNENHSRQKDILNWLKQNISALNKLVYSLNSLKDPLHIYSHILISVIW